MLVFLKCKFDHFLKAVSVTVTGPALIEIYENTKRIQDHPIELSDSFDNQIFPMIFNTLQTLIDSLKKLIANLLYFSIVSLAKSFLTINLGLKVKPLFFYLFTKFEHV
jgi:hypothetical protein